MKKKKGFTLIEIIVCIGLIAVVSVGSIIGIKLVDKKLVINELNQISDKVLNAAEVYIETNKETYNQLYNEKNVTVIPLVTLVNEGYLTLDGTSLTTEKITDKYVTTFLAAKSEENTSECTDITTVFSWEKNSSPIYICTSTTADTSELEEKIEDLAGRITDLESNKNKNEASDSNDDTSDNNDDANPKLLYDVIIKRAKAAAETDKNNNNNEKEKNGIAVYRDNPTTTIGKKSNEDEAELIKTDDYKASTYMGYSYYFRGNVKNNYVNYSNKCWRIVRTLYDNSIKLILEDRDATCNSPSYTGNWTIGNEANFGYYDQYTNTMSKCYGYTAVKFSTTLTTGDSQWARYNNYKSVIDTTNIVTNYYDYYSYNATEYDYKDASKVIKKLVNDSTFLSKLDATYSLENLSIFPITIKEIIYAGGSIDNSNSYYLINQYQINNNLYFWSGDYNKYVGNCKIYLAYTADYNGNICPEDPESTRPYARPTILLKNTVTVTGDGTKTNPYVVQ